MYIMPTSNNFIYLIFSLTVNLDPSESRSLRVIGSEVRGAGCPWWRYWQLATALRGVCTHTTRHRRSPPAAGPPNTLGSVDTVEPGAAIGRGVFEFEPGGAWHQARSWPER